MRRRACPGHVCRRCPPRCARQRTDVAEYNRDELKRGRLAKVLIVADDFVAGGAFAVGERLAHGLAGVREIVFACDLSLLNKPARERLAGAGVKVVRLFAHAGDPRRAICDRDSAHALIRRTQPDVIVFVDSSPRSSIALKDAAHEVGLAYLAVVNFVDSVTPPDMKRWDADVARAANAAAANVFVSAAAREDFNLNFPSVDAPRLVVTNGVPDEFFAPAAAELRLATRRELGVADDELMLLLPGRLEPRKGQQLALSALAALRKRASGPDVQLVFAGHGEDDQRRLLKRRIGELGLTDCARYLGPRDDMPALLDACDIVLMPSQQEADPLISKEAMAKGRPVIASDLTGVREQGHTDLLVPAPDGSPEKTIAAMVETIDDLRRNPIKHAEIGRKLHEIAKRRFTLEQMVDAYSRLLESLPAPRRDRTSPRSAARMVTGAWISFSDPQRTSCLKDGWSDVENEGVWTTGGRARMLFDLDQPTERVSIALQVSALATRGQSGVFDILANGRKVATLTFRDRRRTQRMIPVSSAAPKRRFLVTIVNAGPASPFELGLGEDRRKLGLHVRAVRVDVGASASRSGGGLFGKIAGSVSGLLRGA